MPEPGVLTITQRDRDRLAVLKKAHKKLITQRQAAEELGITARHVPRLLARLIEAGDRAVIHGLRGRSSNRKLSEDTRCRAITEGLLLRLRLEDGMSEILKNAEVGFEDTEKSREGRHGQNSHPKTLHSSRRLKKKSRR